VTRKQIQDPFEDARRGLARNWLMRNDEVEAKPQQPAQKKEGDDVNVRRSSWSCNATSVKGAIAPYKGR